MGGLDLHTVKITVGDSGSNYNLHIYAFDLIVTGAAEQAGNAFVGITETSFNQNTSVTDPTLSNGMGGIAYRYIDDADSTRKWASTEPATASTTLTEALNNDTDSATVASSASFAVDDLVLIKDTSLGYTISQIFRVSSIGGATNLTFQDKAARTTQAGVAHNFAIGSTVTLYGKCDTTVDHSDEQISRSIYPQAFGGGGTGDFQYAATALGAFSYLMDDGISSLWSNDAILVKHSGMILDQQVLTIDDGTANRCAYIFNGTGLDIVINTSNAAANADYYVDGVKVYDHTKGATAEFKIIKLCSGLPMGTHILNIHQMSAVAAQNIHIARFIEYIPKDPSAISSTNEGNIIARRDFCADYVFNSGTGLDDFSKGVNYYGPTRGWKLTDSNTAWTVSQGDNPFYDFLYGIYNTTDAIAETWFYGTGFELVVNVNTNRGIHTLELDGSTDFSGFDIHQSLTKFTAATGALDAYDASYSSYKVGVTGLTEGWHKLKITQSNNKNGSSSNYYIGIQALGVIGGSATMTSPVGALQQVCTANAGDCLDIRKVRPLESEEDRVNFARAIGITSNPTIGATSSVPIPDMTCNIKTKGNPVLIEQQVTVNNSEAGRLNVASVWRDGIIITPMLLFECAGTLDEQVISISFIDSPSPGYHTYTVCLYVNGDTATIYGKSRVLNVHELPGVKNENS
jgi:hypothetical protein